MKQHKFFAAVSRFFALATVALVLVLMLAPNASAQIKSKLLHQFTGNSSDGTNPRAGLLLDATGSLYGTTYNGGNGCAPGCGSIFKLTPNPDGSWTESILFSFTFPGTGTRPAARLIADAAGNLYGTTEQGGAGFSDTSCGSVFQLVPSSDGTWTERLLYTFPCLNEADGQFPMSGVVFDASGSLYGTTSSGGGYYYGGVVYKLTPNGEGSWIESVIHSFTGGDGAQPQADLVFDAAGNLYGTTWSGGTHGYGTVFELTPNEDGSWTENVLHSFSGGKGGASPAAAVVFDATGILYGTTSAGGSYGYGTVFSLRPDSHGNWTGTSLHQFTAEIDGANPVAPLAFDASGRLYGTTANGGTYGYGTVFRLTEDHNGRWNEKVLRAFKLYETRSPNAGVVFDAAGNLYGTTSGGDDSDCSYNAGPCGVVYEIIP